DVVQVQRAADAFDRRRSCGRIDAAAAQKAAEDRRAADATDGTAENLGKLAHRRLLDRGADRLAADDAGNHLHNDGKKSFHDRSPSKAASLPGDAYMRRRIGRKSNSRAPKQEGRPAGRPIHLKKDGFCYSAAMARFGCTAAA